MKKETYIADGRKFQTMEQVEAYAKSKGFRVVNTETLRKAVYVIDLRLIDTPKQYSHASFQD